MLATDINGMPRTSLQMYSRKVNGRCSETSLEINCKYKVTTKKNVIFGKLITSYRVNEHIEVE